MGMRLHLQAAAKAGVRRAVRRLGYDLVPFQDSFRDLQRRLLGANVTAVLDVGANIGQYVDLLRALGYQGRVTSFEPSHEAFEVLNRRANKDALWEARHVALGDSRGTGVLNVSANSVSSSLLEIGDEHTIAAPTSRTVCQESVEIDLLDRQSESIPHDGGSFWLKLDVQGYELNVLRGARQTLSKVSVVQCEMSLRPLYRGQTDFLELCSWLRDVGFHLSHFEPGFQDPQTGRCLQLDGLFLRV